jgi:hypothetical protein
MIAGFPVQVPGYVRPGLVGVQVVKIVTAKRAQGQSCCLDRAFGERHQSVVTDETDR